MATIEALETKLEKAQTAYVLARAARQDWGHRVESAREAQARQRRDAARDALSAAKRQQATEKQPTVRPELGTLKPGQQVIVRRSESARLGRPIEEHYVSAEITKVGQVWIEIAKFVAGQLVPHWRMRRDTQNEGTVFLYSNSSFATLAQHEWDQRQAWARGVLEENGITVRPRSIWSGREVELAGILEQNTPATGQKGK